MKTELPIFVIVVEGALPGMLPGFEPLPADDPYTVLHSLLWLKDPPSNRPGGSPEPEPLHSWIQPYTTDDQGNGTAMDVDEDEDEDESSPPLSGMRYIDLGKHKSLRVHRLRNKMHSVFLVRYEYVDFMTHTVQCEEKNRRFFLTGQPGIGK
jgi:hypothetical protein